MNCGKTSENIELTMHHIKPYSKGGETSVRNLVALCKECNQGIADNELHRFYEMRNLPFELDHGLIQGPASRRAIDAAVKICENLMHTRAAM
jgi:hypothetical protein